MANGGAKRVKRRKEKQKTNSARLRLITQFFLTTLCLSVVLGVHGENYDGKKPEKEKYEAG